MQGALQSVILHVSGLEKHGSQGFTPACGGKLRLQEFRPDSGVAV